MSRGCAVVVGGGIAGLATAVALTARGWRVEVLEQAPAFTEVGAGLTLWPNGIRALDALGLGDRVKQDALSGVPLGVRDTRGDWLQHTDTDALKRRSGPLVVMHRADLLDILRSALATSTLRPAVTVSSVRPDGTVVHSAGETVADLVVGADGVHSAVRRSLWPGPPRVRHAGYVAWRTVTDGVRVSSGGESWGHGERFGYFPMLDGRVYAFATAPGTINESERGSAELRRRFGTWHHPIPQLVDASMTRPCSATTSCGFRRFAPL